jgi:hypothetical protein
MLSIRLYCIYWIPVRLAYAIHSHYGIRARFMMIHENGEIRGNVLMAVLINFNTYVSNTDKYQL